MTIAQNVWYGVVCMMSPTADCFRHTHTARCCVSMRSPWVGSLALLAPAHGFVAQSSAGRGGMSMLKAFVRPSAGGARTVSSAGWKHEGLRAQQQVAPRALSTGCRIRMATGGGEGGKAKKEKVKKPESYYKQTVILPQTEFQQVCD